MPLSQHQIDAYHRDGFLVARDIFAPQERANIRAWIREVETTPYPPKSVLKYFEDSQRAVGERLLRRAENFCPHHAKLYELAKSERLMASIAQLFDEPAVLFKDKINYKLPGGGGYYYHRDGRWWWRDQDGHLKQGWEAYATDFITALVSIDNSGPDSGCIELAAGEHLRERLGDAFGSLAEEDAKAMTFAPYPTRAGDVVFFSALTPHGSGPNLTDAPRRVLYLTYNRRSEGDHRLRYFWDKMNSPAPDAEKSVSARPRH
jgi:ectoine hydroxylase-related dioxygenase (phytanoyl-CoA dioxygenase family)